jgi:ribose transport system ATP-binding protein
VKVEARHREPRQSDEPLLRVEALIKRFSGTTALDGVDFDVLPGEVHALLGENGAGKSTLIKVLAGVHRADSGTVSLRGERRDPAAERLPISFIHQELGLVGSFSVGENVALVAGYPRARGLISWRGLRGEARRVLEDAGAALDPDRPVSELTAAERSIVAIARALAVRAEIVVLDEPTAALPEQDVARLFAVLERLREQGIGIVYVTHRLDEVFRIADRVTVLRDGRRIATTPVSRISPDQLVLQIVGRSLDAVFATPPPPTATVALQVERVRAPRVGPVSFSLHRGEVLGLVGLRGSGHELLARVLFGDVAATDGSVHVGGSRLRPGDIGGAMRAGLGYLSSNRAEDALAPTLTVMENLFPRPARSGVRAIVGRRAERRRCETVLERFDVRPRDPERTVGTLSGGNQQKVVLARWLEMGSSVLLLEEPTTGVDVGAKADIYAMLARASAEGRAIVLVSSDFEEVAFVCHRALVFNRGGVVAELCDEQMTVDRLTSLAAGARPAQEVAAHAD